MKLCNAAIEFIYTDRKKSQRVNQMTTLKDVATRRLTIKQLHLVIAIYEHASIVGAAKALNVTQPTGTKMLKDIETHLGLGLFERTNRGVTPTRYAHALVRHAKVIIAELLHAGQELQDLADGTGGQVSVGTFHTAAAFLVPEAIVLLRQRRPSISIQVMEGTNRRLMHELQRGELDLTVGRLPVPRDLDNIVHEPLYDEEICAVVRAGHPLTYRDGIELADLCNEQWIFPLGETALRQQIEICFQNAGLAMPGNMIESISHLTNRQLLLRTDMICIRPYHVVKFDVESGKLAILPIELSTTSAPVGISYHKEKLLSLAAQTFVELLREVAASIPDNIHTFALGMNGKSTRH